jgi:hypothetical protein
MFTQTFINKLIALLLLFFVLLCLLDSESFGKLRISMRLWPSHARQRVSCCSMRSEGTSEMISRSMSCYFVVIIVLKGNFAKSKCKGY